jgi:hypothetical protein
MKASEIVDKLKSVLLSAEEPQVEAAAEEQVEEPVELEGEEAPAEEPAQEMEYVSKQEFESAIAEMKAMYAAIVEKMGSEEEQMEVPEELAKEEQVDLSADEPAAEPIAHTPEVEESAKMNFFKQNKPRNTMSVVYEKMFNK